jgi:hypothetical protein
MIHAASADARGPSPDGQDRAEAPPLANRPHRQQTVGDVVANINLIVAMSYGRAGSLLIQSLFDSHPNVLTLPYAGAMYSLIPASTNDLNRQIDWFIKSFPIIFDTSGGGYFGDVKDLGAGNFGPNGDEDLRVSSTDFKKQLLGIVNEYCTIDGNRRLSRKEFFIFVHIAYGLCVRSFNVTEIRYIFYHPHSYAHDEWQTMLEDFPKLYLIGMTRDPRQDWVSWKKIYAWRMQRDTSDVPPIFLFLHEYYNYSKGCYELSNLVERLEFDHIRIIDLEKLHIFNKKAMTHLCGWLSIEFNECLLQSTFNGRQWHGNATNGKRVSSLNPNMIRDAWRNELPDHDRQIICLLVPGSIKYFGYEKENPAAGVESENIINHFKYTSDLLLFIHCILFKSCLWGNPLRHLRKFGQSDKQIDKIRIMHSVIRSLGGIVFEGARLFFELRGNKLDRKIAEIVAQQKELLRKNLPPSLFAW